MVSMELLKVVVQPVALERNEDGKIVREHIGEPVAIYDLDQLAEWVEKVREEIAKTSNPNHNGIVVPELVLPT